MARLQKEIKKILRGSGGLWMAVNREAHPGSVREKNSSEGPTKHAAGGKVLDQKEMISIRRRILLFTGIMEILLNSAKVPAGWKLFGFRSLAEKAVTRIPGIPWDYQNR